MSEKTEVKDFSQEHLLRGNSSGGQTTLEVVGYTEQEREFTGRSEVNVLNGM